MKLEVCNRIKEIKQRKLCLNCLRSGHFNEDCRSSNCRKCNSKHNTLLHFEQRNNQAPAEVTQVALPAHTNLTSQVLLSTAEIRIQDKRGTFHTCRALLDSGSQSNIITETLCNKLGCYTSPIHIAIVGVNQAESIVKTKCNLKFKSRHGGYTDSVTCLVMPKICGNIPSTTINISTVNIPSNLKLADPIFNESSPVDVLLGAGTFWKLLRAGQIQLGKQMPILQNTKLGWIVSGSIAKQHTPVIHVNLNIDVDKQLSRFWEVEEGFPKHPFSEEERECERHFLATQHRNAEGRFIVSIPMKNSLDKLGESRDTAIRRFYSLERKLQLNHQMKQRYVQFMQEYLDMGHMSVVPTRDNSQYTYYLPHHGVMKEESLTTKLRVVFDGSAATSSGSSINNLQMIGPTIQNDLFSILIRFRQHTYVVSADIAKMYRQVLVAPEETSLQRIFWRSDPHEPLLEYNLNTVTYGTAAASFLAIRSLHQLAYENIDKFPTISNIILNDFYVDDLLTGSENVEELSNNADLIAQVLKQGCFELRKWVSNCPKVLEQITNSETSLKTLDFATHEGGKTLGLLWSPTSDSLCYSIQDHSNHSIITKRIILSQISQIFDPLGLLSICTITAKILLQDLWSAKLAWDETIPLDFCTKWITFRNELQELNKLHIPRHAICQNYVRLEVHGFCDASEKAYGACLYMRSIDKHGYVSVNLLCARSKVTPLKTISIPRLELCGAVVLSRLTEKTITSLRLRPNSIHYWSDSTIVLGWINTPPNLLKTFVANRVAEIQTSTNKDYWNHVRTHENPADFISRGINPSALLTLAMWWHGPNWLSQETSAWPKLDKQNASDLPEMKAQIHTLMVKEDIGFSLQNFSSLNKLRRCTAYCLRFKANCLKKKSDREIGALSVSEIHNAFMAIIKLVQRSSFEVDLHNLKQRGSVLPSSKIISLKPFTDSEGVIRVGGRLQASDFSFNKKHPILLPARHHLCKILFEEEHIKLLHAGPQHLLASVRENFWPISGRSMAKQVTHNCVRCYRVRPKPANHIMGNLPKARITPAPPFFTTGVDYAGPFNIKNKRGRGAKTSKCFISLFICFVTKAIHLELVTDLSTEAFIASLRRFISRRGKPAAIYSDNGTNFVGANNELEKLTQFFIREKMNLTEIIENEGIMWHFIPPYSPHFGGLWESGVKSVKYHIKRVMSDTSLTYEQFYTVLTQIEACLNSRPLTPLSTDPQDLDPLTPSHFLIGRRLTAVADPDVQHLATNRLNVYQHIQQISQAFWNRWSKEYISGLQQLRKWSKQASQTLKIGDMVLLKEDHLPPLHWQLGRVSELHPGPDDITRVVTIRTRKGLQRRAIMKICPLPSN